MTKQLYNNLKYEEGGENSQDNGDLHSEVFLNECPGGQPIPQRDMNMESQYEYGSRVGVWRILRLFEKFNWKFTCYAVGKAVELNPVPVQAMESAGHEIACHNYRWINYSSLSEEEERKHVHQGIKAIKDAIGKAPVGWYTGRISPRSRQIVIEEYAKLNLPLLYDSDAYNDDLPYYINNTTLKSSDPSSSSSSTSHLSSSTSHLVIPYTLDANDMKFCVPPGFTSPSAFFEYLKNTFDVLYEEGKSGGSPKFMNVGLHCRLVGKPGRLAALKQFMEYVAGFEGVWVCTRQEMAEHWRRVVPPLLEDKEKYRSKL
ncbi:UNVERIFIED_CONTAM: hypothetical protein HDU68_010291 [Siphonaria sp. JEL0065]|nr:hypothetical protein HDU68_010291 [Siphonaria sp. JEL0065]